jgi:hypothetical protein
MGQQNTKLSVKDNKTIINKSQIDILNESITENIANTVIKTASHCGATTTGAQEIKITRVRAEGDINFDLNQKQDVNLNFSCVQFGEVRSEIANDLYKQMMQSLTNSNTTNVIQQLDAAAKLKIDSGFASWGPATNNESDTEITYEQINDNNINLQTVIKNSITNNFTVEDIKTCITSVIGTQTIYADDILAGGNITFGANQEQSIESYQQCSQIQSTAQNITNKITDVLGIEIINQSESNSESSSENRLESEITNQGLFGGLGDLFNGIFSGIGSIFGSLTTPFIICSLIICLCCLCLCFMSILGMMGAFSSGGKSSSYNSDLDLKR